MGGRMAANLLKAGHEVTVWNRSPARLAELAGAGAETAGTPGKAAAGAGFVVSMVRDDEASRSVWTGAEGALAAMDAGAVAVESATLTVAWVRDLAGECRDRGVAFLDAPVAGSRPQAEAAQLIFLVGGDAAVFERTEPLLLAMGGAAHHVGPAGSGAAVKLMVNALFGIQMAAMGELIGFARRLGLDPEAAVRALASTPACSPAARLGSEAMLAEKYAPLFPIELVAKDFAYAAQTAAAAGAAVPVTQAARAVFDRAEAEGYGPDNITGVARLYR
jgi:3-hydroxyisobutyrate dehydrogenase-like beta-hydroxyacid dehydrogenase